MRMKHSVEQYFLIKIWMKMPNKLKHIGAQITGPSRQKVEQKVYIR